MEFLKWNQFEGILIVKKSNPSYVGSVKTDHLNTKKENKECHFAKNY